jgi:hypothetical protein
MDEWTHRFPRGEVASARLVFPSGVAPRLDVRSAPLGDELARGRFPDPAPRVALQEEELSLDYHGLFRWFFLGRYPDGALEISDALPWSIDVEGGVAKADFDLRTVPLRRFEVSGGAAKVELRLGAPRGLVPVRLTGGAAKLRLVLPPGVAARLRITGGAAHLAFLDQSLTAVGGGLALTSRGFDEKGDGYDIKIGGGAARLAIEEGSS